MPCKALIRIKDKVPPDHPNHFQLPRAWEVVTIIPATGWDLGRMTMASDEVIWVDLDMDVEEAEQHFTMTEFSTPEATPENPMRRKARLNPNLLPTAILAAAQANVKLDLVRPKTESEAEEEVLAWFAKERIDRSKNEALFKRLKTEAIETEPIVPRKHEEIKQEYIERIGIPSVGRTEIMSAIEPQSRESNPFDVIDDPFVVK